MPHRSIIHTDLLVLGSGVAGLSLALSVADQMRVVVAAKCAAAETNTNYAQGGIAAALAGEAAITGHIRDTCESGDGLCHADAVRTIIQESAAAIDQLTAWGVDFARTTRGDFDLAREGGHGERRILHAGDRTGHSIQQALLDRAMQHPRITLLPLHSAVDLITNRTLARAAPPDERPMPTHVYGAYLLDRGRNTVKTIAARAVCLATGGAGKVYLYTTNPDVACGDGIAMAYRAGAAVANLEFMQFHPTCLFHPAAKSFLISEAVRGEGGLLRLVTGERFMARYDARGELATRDIVARAIDAELKHHGHDYVVLDISHRPADFVRERFPSIYATCLRYGIDITTQPIPVVPAAHYLCGGVVTDLRARTNLDGLLACGEVAHTGLHGANRLASNSLLEGIVMARRAAETVRLRLAAARPAEPEIPLWDAGGATDSDESVVISHNWDEIRRTMWNYVGIVRSDKRLARAAARLALLQQEIQEYYWNFTVTNDLIELRNIALVAQLMVQCAQQRRESRGLHYNLTTPQKLPTAADTVLRRFA
ncbi:MAG: L-aspartate oxidase [Deltaproteobacteria bacterium]|nr:L-aspartate oxidase [Deltaproteobacteria bacterium]